MVAVCRLRCLPVLLLVYCVVSSVEGTNTGPSSRGGQDRRNAANKQRRSTASDQQESSNSPQLPTAASIAGGQHDPMSAPWVPEPDERARHGNSVKVTRKTKARKNGTYGGHVAVTTETGFTTDALPLATDHVIPSDLVTASVEPDGSKRARPSGGKSIAITRTTAETAEPSQRTTEVSIPQRNHRVKTTTTTTTYPTTNPTRTTTTLTTATIATPSTTAKFPARKHSTTTAARNLPFGGRTSSTTRYSNRTTSHPSSAKGEGCSSSCEMHRCETVEAEVCQGRVVKDRCNCCPVCFVERSTDESREDVTTKKTTHHQSNACDGMQCPKHKVCILNIQGIPMCRCPNSYSCKGIDRNPLCAQNGMTYKNKCFLKVDECTIGHRIRINHRGSCRSKPTPAQLETSVMMWKTSRFDSDYRTQQATHHRKSGKNDPWRHAATNNDKTKSAKLRKREGNKSQFS